MTSETYSFIGGRTAEEDVNVGEKPANAEAEDHGPRTGTVWVTAFIIVSNSTEEDLASDRKCHEQRQQEAKYGKNRTLCKLERNAVD